MDKQIKYTVNHPDYDLTLSWGDAFNAPLVWGDDDIPTIDTDFLKDRGWK